MCSKQKNTEEEFAKRAETACEGQIDYGRPVSLSLSSSSSSPSLLFFIMINQMVHTKQVFTVSFFVVIKATLLERNVSSSTDLYHFRVKNLKLGMY